MTRLLPILQFLPLTIFLGVARHYGYSNSAWPTAFQWGAFAAIVEFAILIPTMKNQINRMIAGANLFLITGGVAFYFKIEPLIDFLGELRASALILFTGIACLVATAVTSTGVFETKIGGGQEKKFSIYFLVVCMAAFAWSYHNRTDPVIGGALPFVLLIFVKQAMKR